MNFKVAIYSDIPLLALLSERYIGVLYFDFSWISFVIILLLGESNSKNPMRFQ